MKFNNVKKLKDIYYKVFRYEILKRALRLISYKINSLKYLDEYYKNRNNILLVYTMGKVGSSTIYETLRKKLAFNKIFHVHFLTAKNIKWREDFKNNSSASIMERYTIRQIKNNPKKKLKVISIVRDITSRDLSMIFQNIDSFFTLDEVNNDIINSKIEELFNNQNQELSINWFDNEFKEFLGIDIYNYKFDKEKGYSIYSINNVDILIITLESLNSCWDEALQTFMNTKFNTLIEVNETSDKKTSNLYKQIKAEIRISNERLENNYSSKYMNHFYSKKEIDLFNNKWLHK